MSDPNAVQKVAMTDLVSHFEKIRNTQGEEAYQKARMDFAVAMILKPRGDQFVQGAFPDLDLEAVKVEAEKRKGTNPAPGPAGQNPQEMMLNAMRQQIPNLKTQAQFNIFMSAFDALRHTLNLAFGRDLAGFEKGKEALNKALASAYTISEIIEKLQDSPEAATSKAAEEFKNPPREFQEYDVQKSLLAELSTKTTVDDLTRWYEANRARIDCVVSQTLRNELFDAIRNKKHELTPAS
jgi:hypothetical protein